MTVRDHRPATSTVAGLMPWLLGLLTMLATVFVSVSGVVVTAGGVDQTLFHLPTIEKFRSELPWPDIVDVQTATTPLYHLFVASTSLPLGGSTVVVQVIGSLFAAALAVVVAYSVRAVESLSMQLVLVVSVMFSTYFWESALWIGTDCAATLLTVGVMFSLVRSQPRFWIVGVLCALAILTRQSCAWLLLPAAVVAVSGNPSCTRARDLAAATVPGTAVLAVVFWVWKGATPPRFAEINGLAVSGAAVSYGVVLAGVFALALLLSIRPNLSARELWWAAPVGVVAALPAVIFASSVTLDDTRTGGWLWSIVGRTPSITDRSSGLVVAAFLGGMACSVLVRRLDRRTALVVVSAFLGLVLVLTFGARLYQKYFELPILVMYVMCACSALRAGIVGYRWPFVVVALVQVVLSAGIVGLPLVRALL
ncbi:hypothetical protein [Rhodococcus sp. NPDC058521]|uniref:hypothetical protein n=1 Tax=Rhodococcus sp. NPDC058521 TaxID=3346536 RepID=UPI003647E343